MWLTSDKVTKETIQACSASCEKTECKFSARIGETTCMGVSDFYDKDGNHIIHDGNDKQTKVECFCGRAWIVEQRRGIIKSTEIGKSNDKN